MALKDFMERKHNGFYAILIGVTFVCCSMIIYYTLHDYGRRYSSRSSLSNPSLKQAGKLRTDECKSWCQTEDCIDIGNDIIKYMKQSVDPCEDFFQFSCGNFQEKYGLETDHNTMKLQEDRLGMAIKDVIETSEETLYPGSAAQKLKTTYDSCMDMRSIEMTGFQTIMSFINQSGIWNWPNLSPHFTFSNPTLGEILGILLAFQEDIFVKFFSMKHEILATMPDGKCENCTDEVVKNIVTDILEYAGTDHENINIAWDSFVEVENAITEIRKNNSPRSRCERPESLVIDCKTENSLTKSIICDIAHSTIRHAELSSRFSAETVSLQWHYACYIQSISQFLERHNPRALAHYIALKVIFNNLKYTNFIYRKQYETLKKKMEGDRYTPVEKERWKFCVSYVKKNIIPPLGLMYVKEMFSQEAIDEIDDMVHEYKKVTSQFILAQENILNGTNEVDDLEFEFHYTRENFTKQIETEKNHIIDVINLFKNKTEIDEAYETFLPRSNDFLYNAMQLSKRRFLSKYMESSVVEEQMEAYQGKENLFEANAASNDGTHLFFGILLPPFYKYERPKLFKVARLGETIALEIGHLVYNNLRELTEIFKGTRQYMEENTGCRKTQYAEFELKRIGQKLKPSQTENEDFADNMAVQVIEKVVESLFENNTRERMIALPGLNFNAYELLYILYAQTFCETRSIEAERQFWKFDPHSPNKYRIIGTLQNSKRFSEVFRCPEATYMNPQKKCPVFL